MFRRKYFLNIFNLSSRDQEGGRNKVRERRAWLFCRTHGRSWGWWFMVIILFWGG